MKLQVLFVGISIGLLLSACGTGGDVRAVTQVVTGAETAAQNAMQGHGTLADVQQYFANTLESGNIDTQMARHIAFSAALAQPPGGLVRMSNFQITGVNVNLQKGEARVIYQVDITLWKGPTQQTETVTQDLLLVDTPTRGWRIAGGDGAETTDTNDNTFLGNLMGQ